MTESGPDKRQSAAALAYSTGDAAPRVVAKGQGLVAQQIIERARAAGVFVHESADLVTLLMQVDLDNRIPPALYRAIAELLAWLYHVDAARDTGAAPPPPPAYLPGDLPESLEKQETPETRKHDGES